MKEGDKIPLASASASRTQRGQRWPPQAKAGGKNTSFLGAHLLSCCCSHSQGTFLCSGKQELCARHSPHLCGPGGRGGQARQLPLARQELTEKARSLLSNLNSYAKRGCKFPLLGARQVCSWWEVPSRRLTWGRRRGIWEHPACVGLRGHSLLRDGTGSSGAISLECRDVSPVDVNEQRWGRTLGFHLPKVL